MGDELQLRREWGGQDRCTVFRLPGDTAEDERRALQGYPDGLYAERHRATISERFAADQGAQLPECKRQFQAAMVGLLRFVFIRKRRCRYCLLAV